jgi:hypothetical protein
MSATVYFRSLAARCRTSARDCSDNFTKEELHRLAREFETRADQLAVLAARQPGWWLARREQPRGFKGDR